MRAWLFAVGLLAMCLINEAGTAHAASGGNLPGGSWSQTCRDGAMNYNMLYAQCRRLNGSWWYSTIDPRSCGNRGVGNNDGTLICEAGGGGNLPGGSWRQSCRNGNMNHNVLHAQCQRVNGSWRNSTIDPRGCGNRGVGNNDGNLVCEGGGGGNLPGGSWRQSCRNGNMNYNMLYAQCQRVNGSWRVSSIDPRSCGNRGVGNNDGNLVCEGNGGGNLPSGSWRQSCRNGNMYYSTLNAQCQRVNGSWRNSSLDTRSCGNRGVGNNDGNLVCEGGGSGNLPGGSWRQSCRNGNMNFNTLYAQCQRVNGSWRDSSIDTRSCGNRGVGNNDGNLVCE